MDDADRTYMTVPDAVKLVDLRIIEDGISFTDAVKEFCELSGASIYEGGVARHFRSLVNVRFIKLNWEE